MNPLPRVIGVQQLMPSIVNAWIERINQLERRVAELENKRG